MRVGRSSPKSERESRIAWTRNPMGRGEEMGFARKEAGDIEGSREME
jgi:hypothetical protein